MYFVCFLYEIPYGSQEYTRNITWKWDSKNIDLSIRKKIQNKILLLIIDCIMHARGPMYWLNKHKHLEYNNA